MGLPAGGFGSWVLAGGAGWCRVCAVVVARVPSENVTMGAVLITYSHVALLIITYNSSPSAAVSLPSSSGALRFQRPSHTLSSKSPVQSVITGTRSSYRRLPSHPQGRGGVTAVKNTFRMLPRLEPCQATQGGRRGEGWPKGGFLQI